MHSCPCQEDTVGHDTVYVAAMQHQGRQVWKVWYKSLKCKQLCICCVEDPLGWVTLQWWVGGMRKEKITFRTREGEGRGRKEEREGKRKGGERRRWGGRETGRGRRKSKRVREREGDRGEYPQSLKRMSQDLPLGCTTRKAHYLQVPPVWSLRKNSIQPQELISAAPLYPPLCLLCFLMGTWPVGHESP